MALLQLAMALVMSATIAAALVLLKMVLMLTLALEVMTQGEFAREPPLLNSP